MRLSNISPLGWTHTVACVVAMVAGTRQLVGRKGTAAHALSGSIYFVSMLIANVTVLSIFHGEDVIFRRGQPPVPGYGLGFFHWLAIITLALVLQPVIAQKTRVCAFERAGYGFSDRGPRPQILSDMVDDLHAALKAGPGHEIQLDKPQAVSTLWTKCSTNSPSGRSLEPICPAVLEAVIAV
jgi:uncharacterized membrane protein